MSPQSQESVSAKMRRVRSANTTPERVFRKSLWRSGLRYSVCKTELPGKPDIVLSSKKIAIFIDGDLWHGGQWRTRGKVALEDQFRNTASREYWLKKLRRNVQRDCEVTNTLILRGWTVLRFWESDIESNLDHCVELTLRVVRKQIRSTSVAILPQKNFAEFFAGIGLVRMALELQGWNAEFANDFDEQKKKMYCGHFGADDDLIVKDIRELSSDEVPEVALATASFPCNDLSLAGARAGIKAGSSASFWDFIKILKNLEKRRPPLVLLENVPGFLTSNGGMDFREAMMSLNELGYTLDSFIIDAVSFVPHSRKRLFVIGILDRIRNHLDEKRARLECVESPIRPKSLVEFIKSNNDIRWNIRQLPEPPQRTQDLQDILEDLPDDAAEWWSDSRVEYLLSQMSVRHRAQADKMMQGAAWSFGTIFRRMRNGRSMAELRVDGIAGCLRTPRGGSGRQILFKAGKEKCFVRLLNAQDAARLMGADEFKISVSRNQALFGFGDAVCVPVVEWIAKYYLNPLVNELIHSAPLTRNGSTRNGAKLA